MIRDPTARDAWKYLEDEFLGQRESRALLIEAEFRSFKQGVLSVTDYCRRLETMAAFLKEFGDPIGDRQLVLTLLRGLNAKFRHMVSNLKMQRPFPTFAEARTLLLLEEIDIHDVIDNPCSEPKTGTQAFVVQQPPRTPAAPGGFGAPSGGTGGNGKGGRNRRRGCGNNSSHSGTNNKGAGQPGSRPGTPLPPPGYGYGAGGHGGHGAPGSGYGASGFGAPWPGWHPGYGVYPPRPPVDQQPQAGQHMMAHQGGYQQPPSRLRLRRRHSTTTVSIGWGVPIRALESHGRWVLGSGVSHQQLQRDDADAAQLRRMVCRLRCRFAHDRPTWYTLLS
jgi:hypothetical protein